MVSSLVVIILFIVIGLCALFFIPIIISANKGAKNRMPVCTVDARVQTKYSTRADEAGNIIYYVVFELENQNRFKLTVPAQEYNRLSEKAIGKLSFQETDYIGFYLIPNVQSALTKTCPYCMSAVAGSAVKCNNCGGNF